MNDRRKRALNVLPGGVNSPVRAFGSVGSEPLFAESAKGAYLKDASGNRYLDLLCSWGAVILGHADGAVNKAAIAAIEKGSSFGLCHENEAILAELIRKAMPSMELVRMVSSGTEAVMSAVRLARGFTGRSKIVKFEGCYHGHSDAMLVKAGSGPATFSVPTSSGLPLHAADDTLVAGYNDAASVERLFNAFAGDIAAVIVEPVAGNMGVVPPDEGFLQSLRSLCDSSGALLIFDEVITGFRIAFGGAQALYGVTPDLTTIGKIIGGGFPCAAFGGKCDIMELLAPLGPVYQAGTLSGNPVAVAAGIEVLKQLAAPGIYEQLERIAGEVVSAFESFLTARGDSFVINRVGSMFTIFFVDGGKVRSFDDLRRMDTSLYASFHADMMRRGILLPPSAYESCFISLAHSAEDFSGAISQAM
ncbi:MAG: glutamate-1-semialdehyde 2,1-aminomutase [Phycisphaerae bacterium]